MKNKLVSYSPVVIFLILEVLAFVTFSFGNSFLLYGILGIIILALILLVSFKEIKVDGLVRSGFFIFPLFIFGVITVLSNCFNGTNIIDVTTKVFIPISLVCFSACGAILSLNKSFKISTALLVIYSTIALLTLLNFIVTMCQFGPFHTIFYKEYYMYYGGVKSSVGAQGMAYALVGYQFNEVTLGYYSLFPSLLLTSSIMLFFTSYKKDKWIFLAYLFFSLLAFISLLFSPNKLSLITDVVVLVIIAILILFSKKILSGKIIKIGSLILILLAIIGIVLLFFNAQDWGWLSGFKNFISNNAFLNKIFNGNYIAENIKGILNNLFTKDKIFGFYLSYPIYDIPVAPSNSWFFDNLFTSGFFGAIFFLFALVFAIFGLNKYMKYSNDDLKDKTLLYGFIITFMIYNLISGDINYLIFKQSYNFLFTSGPFLVVVCLFAYANSKGRCDYNLFLEKEAINETQA